jgi:hypothetical protein
LSPYLFLFVLELLAAALKNDKDMTGVQIENSEFLLSQIYLYDSKLYYFGGNVPPPIHV